ncbi:Galactose-1-phosphate uridylyltransferase [Smittium mucronatum]|uniref:Galactose-1-phosphate uridylyltransferase n=1 Tax=Smittium mucronatum TaxID=133383 RepID=A0A1R0GMV9_9FUNG|nr:Galactose-1-phosphate uridylyltransferase [Smittium mucronatum]OLY82967.1 Galactose-1-phosphate uridylyltransferase [Smittium mucronatum]
MSFDVSEHPHKRFNILMNSWVLVSPHRAKRPWLGQTENHDDDSKNKLKYDPKCYLCPGNKRVTGDVNADYKEPYIFDNDFPAVLSEQPSNTPSDLFELVSEQSKNSLDLFKIKSVRGRCQVICYSPDHSLTFADLSRKEIFSVIKSWLTVYINLSPPLNSRPENNNINYIQIFENKGSEMGCSNPHPHGQVWALESVSQKLSTEINSMKEYAKEKSPHSCMLCDYVLAETETKTRSLNSSENSSANRIVLENDTFVALVPFWAVWPFETMVLPKSHISSLFDLIKSSPGIDINSNHQDLIKNVCSWFDSLDPASVSANQSLGLKQVGDLADILSGICKIYDKLFNCSFPYSMGIHQSPVLHHKDAEFCHLHFHFYPPLLRSATVKKFLVGYEMMGEEQRDLTPEQAAQRLRDLI